MLSLFLQLTGDESRGDIIQTIREEIDSQRSKLKRQIKRSRQKLERLRKVSKLVVEQNETSKNKAGRSMFELAAITACESAEKMIDQHELEAACWDRRMALIDHLKLIVNGRGSDLRDLRGSLWVPPREFRPNF